MHANAYLCHITSRWCVVMCNESLDAGVRYAPGSSALSRSVFGIIVAFGFIAAVAAEPSSLQLRFDRHHVRTFA